MTGYRLKVPPNDFDWPQILAIVGIAKLRFEAGTLVVDAPLTLPELDALLFYLDEHATDLGPDGSEVLYTSICSAQDELLNSAPEKELTDWVQSVLLKEAWFPAIRRQSDEGTASGLHDFAGQRGPEFYLRARAAVEALATHLDLCLPTLSPEAIRNIILAVAYFDIRSALPRLRAAAEAHALQAMDVGGQTAATLCIRVLAGMLNEDYVEYLRGKLNDPLYAASVYDGLVAHDVAERDRSFWDAAIAAATLPDVNQTAVYSVCETLFANPPVDVLPWVKQLMEELILRSDDATLARPFFECLCARSNLVSLKWRAVTSAHPKLEPYRCVLLLRRPHSAERKHQQLMIPPRIAGAVMEVLPEDSISYDQGMEAVERSWEHT